MSDEQEFIFKHQKNATTQVRAYFSEYKGKSYFNIREWWLDERDGEYKPGKGFAIPAEQAEDFLSGLTDAHQSMTASPAKLRKAG